LRVLKWVQRARKSRAQKIAEARRVGAPRRSIARPKAELIK